MGAYKAIVNPHTGNLTLIRSDSAFHLKDSVATYNDLPIIGNTENDVRITQDDDKMFTWGISASSGNLNDWKEIGSASSVDWSAITGKPSSSPANIDDAVSKRHTQNTDDSLILEEAPSSDQTATGMKGSFTTGENVDFGDVCYFKSDGKMWKADADTEATSYCIGMALGTISADASGEFLLIGIAREDTWDWTVGSPVYLSITAGEITQTAPSGSGEIVQILGIATHADRIYFKPELVQVEIA